MCALTGAPRQEALQGARTVRAKGRGPFLAGSPPAPLERPGRGIRRGQGPLHPRQGTYQPYSEPSEAGWGMQMRPLPFASTVQPG
jgi:hypothetical protein